MSHDRGSLALCFGEAITAIVRLRAGRESVSDPEQFRDQMRHSLQQAARSARDSGGYQTSDVRSATFAVVAFLDESILNSGAPAFADWARKPLQEELFGTHVAGDLFFGNLRELLGRPDSSSLADVLEVYALCLLLGFAGRYTGGRRGELGAVITNLRDRIRRIRPSSGEFSPFWMPDARGVIVPQDPWIRRLTIAAIMLVCGALLLFFVSRVSLEAGVSQARGLALEVRH